VVAAAAAVILTVLALVAVATGLLPEPVRATAAPEPRATTGQPGPPPRTPEPTAGHRTPRKATGPPASSTPTALPLLARPDAATRDPREVVGALLAARARLWNAPDLTSSLRPESLATVHASGSASRAEDVRLLGRARASGFRYQGVGFTVRSASVRVSGDRVTIEATIDAAAYVVRAADGSTDRRAARTGQLVEVVVTRTPAGWRLSGLAVRS
jgi:hypothetical protein